MDNVPDFESQTRKGLGIFGLERYNKTKRGLSRIGILFGRIKNKSYFHFSLCFEK